MKKILVALLTVLLVSTMCFGFAGCALLEMFDDNKNVVDLGDGETAVKWNLVSNNNKLSNVQNAYFEFDSKNFKYYEDGVLKKQGEHHITYEGPENTISPLTLVLNFGKDDDGFRIFDYLECYTEDTKEGLHQFTIMSEGYHIDPPRAGGVPVRDYHLSSMPYAFGTYVKEGTTETAYKNGKANYLNCAKLDGTFVDELGNSFYFANNSFCSDPQGVSYTIYMRYENATTGTFVEGTIKMSQYEDWDTKEMHSCALIYVMHGENEPTAESGISVEADYQLEDFDLGDNMFTLGFGEYFDEESTCTFDPTHFVGGTYNKVMEN